MKIKIIEDPIRFIKNIRNWSIFFTSLTILLGFLVLMAWYFEIEFLKRPIPHLVAMNPVTALCFVLSGTSLFLFTLPQKLKYQKVIGYCFTSFIILIGSLKLITVFTDIDIPVDSWLYHSKLEKDLSGNISNNLAPNTAIAFILTGIALLLTQNELNKTKVYSQYFALSVGFLGLLSILGYLYRIQIFYKMLYLIPMAIHTGICFLTLSFSILFVNAKRGLMEEFTSSYIGSIIARYLIPSAIFIPFLLGLVFLYAVWNSIISLELGMSLFIISIIIIFFILIWHITKALNKKDMLRKQIEINLQHTNNELEAFSYSVAHDLRAPLRGIHGFAEILKEDYQAVLDNQAERMLNNIINNSIKIGDLIDGLMTLSGLEKRSMEKNTIDLTKLTQSQLEEINKSIEHNAQVQIDDLGLIVGDPLLINQVMYNLISNAIKYSSKKEHPMIHIFRDEIENEIIISVKDNGAGFDMQYANKLFNAFQRLHKQKEFEGVGIGLTIIKRIVTKHGGRVFAKGLLNEGATFSFTIPKALRK